MAGYLAVLFDVDETLYDRTKAQPLILRHIMAQLPELFAGQAEEKVVAAYERSDQLTAEHVLTSGSIRATRNRRTRIFLEEFGLDSDAAVEAVTEQYVAAYRCVNTPIDGAVKVVEACVRHLRVAVISNAFSDVQYHKLESIGLSRQTFEFVLLSEDIGIRKPDPAIFLKGCQLLEIEPGQALYVGDSFRNDVIGAAAAGMDSCWFNPEAEPPPEGASVRPEYEIRALTQLLPLIDGGA